MKITKQAADPKAWPKPVAERGAGHQAGGRRA